MYTSCLSGLTVTTSRPCITSVPVNLPCLAPSQSPGKVSSRPPERPTDKRINPLSTEPTPRYSPEKSVLVQPLPADNPVLVTVASIAAGPGVKLFTNEMTLERLPLREKETLLFQTVVCGWEITQTRIQFI